MKNDIQINTSGTIFEMLIADSNGPVDISTATIKKIRFRKPNGEELIKNASFLSDGVDGYIKYVTVPGDIDVLGYWEIQSYVEIDSDKWYSPVEKFRVLRNTTN